MPIFAPVERLVGASVGGEGGVGIAGAVGMAMALPPRAVEVSAEVVVGDVAVPMARLSDDVLEVMACPSVAARRMPSPALQQEALQHHEPSSHSVSATLVVGSPPVCARQLSPSIAPPPPTASTPPPSIPQVQRCGEQAYLFIGAQVPQAQRALPRRIGAAAAPVHGLTIVRVQAQAVRLARVLLDDAARPVRAAAHADLPDDLVAGLERGRRHLAAVGVVAGRAHERGREQAAEQRAWQGGESQLHGRMVRSRQRGIVDREERGKRKERRVGRGRDSLLISAFKDAAVTPWLVILPVKLCTP